MRIYAQFEMSTGNCVGYVATSDPTFTKNEFYEEVTDPLEKDYVQHKPCKKIIVNGQRKIVLL